MFTGIVEELGSFVSASPSAPATRLEFAATKVIEDVAVGDSIAVNGCCLTVVEHGPTSFAVEAVEETLSRTNLGSLRTGEPVNLERSLALGHRLGGHLVLGHVDGIGVVTDAAPHLGIEVPGKLARFLAEKGSITVDGCSLTLVEVRDSWMRIEIIPHTSAVTTLGRRMPGEIVNLETDVVAKYVERLVRAGVPSPYDAHAAGSV
ncbi:MAG TPA: riboflavin synthase [Acidimicrobiales bacterium]|nr:riboflavin synthase [Acidimicrobiales bacterium]